jgi:PAS domain S-box-containing protein
MTLKHKLLLIFSIVLISINLLYLLVLQLWQDIANYQLPIQLFTSLITSLLLAVFYFQMSSKQDTAEEENETAPRKVVLQTQENAVSVYANTIHAYKNSQTSDQLLANYFPNFLCIKDAEGRWLAANYEWLRLFNLEQADYWGKTDQELIESYPNCNVDKLKTCIIQDKSAWHQRCSLTETKKMSENEAWIITRTPTFDREQKKLKLLITGEFTTDTQNLSHTTRIADAFNEGHISCLFLNRDFIITDINNPFTQLTGYSDKEIVDKPLTILIDGAFSISHNEFFKDNNKQFWSKELRCKRKDGTLFPLKLDITAIAHEKKPIVYFASLTDITRQKQIEKRIMQLSYYDDLTGLPNRAMFFDRLSRIVANPVKQGNCDIILFLDLDRFKAVNDSFGHEIGNMLLKEVSKRLTS